LQALANASWPGRCQSVELGGANVPTELRLDGAHTPISVQAGFDWFCSVNRDTTKPDGGSTKRILIFNTSHERNPVELLQIMLPSSNDIRFEKAFFCRSDVERPSAETKKSAKDLLEGEGVAVNMELVPDSSATVTWQMTLEAIWKHLEARSSVTPAETVVNLSVKEALDQIRTVADSSTSRIEVFVIGSLLLVGSTLNAIGWSEQEAEGGLK
jgi:folylpolyglutamate synthase/dihydropteroate synthase